MRDESPGEFQNRPFRAFSAEYELSPRGLRWVREEQDRLAREARTDRNVRLAEENLREERVREIVREELKVMLGRGVRVGESRVSVGEIVDEVCRRERLRARPEFTWDGDREPGPLSPDSEFGV